MNREIKFRAKTISGEWVYGNLIYSSDACKEYETLIIPQKDADGFTTDYASNGENKESYGFDNWFCVISETVGQYTNLNDEKNNEIYEGDLLEFTYVDIDEERYSSIYEVVFINGCFMSKFLSQRPPEYEILSEFLIIREMETLEVIGNIYENTELLEERM